MNVLKRIVGVCFVLLGSVLLALVAWELLAPAGDVPAPAVGLAGLLPSLSLGLLWLAMGVLLLRRKPRA